MLFRGRPRIDRATCVLSSPSGVEKDKAARVLSWSLSVEHGAAHSARQPLNPSSALAWSLHDPHGPAPVESEARGFGQVNRELSTGGFHRHQSWVFLILKLFHQRFGLATL